MRDMTQVNIRDMTHVCTYTLSGLSCRLCVSVSVVVYVSFSVRIGLSFVVMRGGLALLQLTGVWWRQAIETIRMNAGWLQRDGAAVKAWLSANV